MKLLLACLGLLGGCYLELGVGAGRTMGPQIHDQTEWVITISEGVDFSAPNHRVLVGGTVDWVGGGSVQPGATGLSLGTDVKIAGGDTSQTRLSARVAPLTLSWLEAQDGSQRGYAVPLYLGISRAFECNEDHWCPHVGVGVESVAFHRNGYGYGAFVGPQFRISTTSGLLDRWRSDTGRAQ